MMVLLVVDGFSSRTSSHSLLSEKLQPLNQKALKDKLRPTEFEHGTISEDYFCERALQVAY